MSSRLGGGEFQYVGGFNVARQEPGLAENGPKKDRLEKEGLFLEAVFLAAPEAQASLEQIWEALTKSIGGMATIPEKEISDWCKRWNLNAPWCNQIAKQLLWWWSRQLQPGGEEFSPEAVRERSSNEEKATQPFCDRFQVDFGSWGVTLQTRKKFEERCKDGFNQALKMFCDRIEQQALDAGMERTREKREFDHFYWLARRVVHGESASCMKEFTAALDHVSVRAINKAVNELARDLELTLGRPRQNIIRQRVVREIGSARKRRKRSA